MFHGNNIHVELSKNQNHRPSGNRGDRDMRTEGPPPMGMPPAGYSMPPGMPYPPPPHMPGYGMPPPPHMPMAGQEPAGYNGAAAAPGGAPSSAYPGYPAPYGMPYPPPPMPMFSRSVYSYSHISYSPPSRAVDPASRFCSCHLHTPDSAT